MNCADDTESIVNTIKVAMNESQKALCQNVVSPYGDGHAAERIAAKSFETVMGSQIDLKKQFYNMEFSQ